MTLMFGTKKFTRNERGSYDHRLNLRWRPTTCLTFLLRQLDLKYYKV